MINKLIKRNLIKFNKMNFVNVSFKDESYLNYKMFLWRKPILQIIIL